MASVHLVEDDETLGMTLQMTLQANGHDVIWSKTLADARSVMNSERPDLIILDLGLPDGDGMDLCHELRQSGSMASLLIVTARGTLQARVEGLTAGADDYLTKPFELPELLARADACLRRQRWQGRGERVQVGELSVDFGRMEASVSGEAILLTELEFKLLRYLLDHVGEPVSREDLLTEVWGLSASTRTRTVDVFISRLRRHIEPDLARPKHIVNVRGIGYRLVLASGK